MEDLVEFPLKCMNICGYLVPNPNLKCKIKLFVFEFIVILTLIISIINYFYLNDMDEFTDNMQGNSGWFNTFSKFTWCIYYKTEFLNLFEKRKGFWNTNNCSTTTKNRVSWILKTVIFLQKTFIKQAMVLVCGFMIPYSFVKKGMPLGNFKISVDPLIYFVVWICNSITLTISGAVMISFDCLFMGLCYEVIAQFKILGDHVEALNVENINSEQGLEDYDNKFKSYLNYHKFLLRYIQDMKDCFSMVYLTQFLASAPMCCTFIYVGLESPSVTKKLLMIGLIMNIIAEFALYCIPATYMTEEAPKIATAIYNSNWYGKHFIKLKRSTQLMINDAQQEIRMTSLGGMVEVNSTTLITIVRTSFSICTVLRNLKK